MNLREVPLSDHLSDDVVLFEIHEDDGVLDHLDPQVHMLLVVMVELHLTTTGHQEEAVYVTTIANVLDIFFQSGRRDFWKVSNLPLFVSEVLLLESGVLNVENTPFLRVCLILQELVRLDFLCHLP